MMRFCFLLFCFVGILGCSKQDTPTGVTRSDIEGVWATSLNNTTLMGRVLTGDSDWQFQRDTFEILFLDPPIGQAERISGDWKFSDGKMVMVLRSSFPIAGDVGATDSLFISVLNNQMSLQTSAGSDILLVKLSALMKRVGQPIWAHLPVVYSYLFGV